MNILYICQYAGSPQMGRVDRPYHMATNWQAQGHRVTVVAAGFSVLRMRNPVVEEDLEAIDLGGVEYRFFKTPAYSGNDMGWLKNTTAFVTKLSRHAKRLVQICRPDVVIASSTHPCDIGGAEKIAELAGAVLVYEIHDLWPLTPIALYGYSPLHPVMAWMQRCENRALERTDRIVSVLPHTDRYIARRGYDVGRWTHIPGGITPQTTPPEERAHRHIDCLRRYREDGRFIVLYSGSLGKGSSLEVFVRAAKLLEEEGVQFVTVGGGDCKDDLWALAAAQGVRNITFCSAVAKDQVPDLLALADVLYVGAPRNSLYRYGVGMNKLLDYMAAAKPVLYGVEGAGNPVREAGCGITIPAQDEQALAKAVRVFQSMPEHRRCRMGENGWRYVRRRHNYQILSDQYLDCLIQARAEFRQNTTE